MPQSWMDVSPGRLPPEGWGWLLFIGASVMLLGVGLFYWAVEIRHISTGAPIFAVFLAIITSGLFCMVGGVLAWWRIAKTR